MIFKFFFTCTCVNFEFDDFFSAKQFYSSVTLVVCVVQAA